MGNLLSSAIKMQGGVVANPTLVIDYIDYSVEPGPSVAVYKNGLLFGFVTSGVQLSVPIVAGNTFYLQITAPMFGFINADYFFNLAYQTTFSTNTTTNTTTITASGLNAYYYNVVADLF